MKRLMALACSAALAVGMLATTGNDASARDWNRHGGWHNGGGWHHGGGWHRGGGWGTGAAIGGAIIGGAIIGNALSGPYYGPSYDPYYDPYYRPYYRPRVVYRSRPVYRSVRMSNAHVEWCYNRYRSYRAYDNTFQPYNGPRQLCYSPYE